MRAAVARAGAVAVEHVEVPAPGEGQVLVASRAAGICGSDLHLLEVQAQVPELVPPMVLGHEFCAELLDHGPGADRRIPTGALVCSVPYVDGAGGPELVGLTPSFPGALSERFVLQEHRLVAVPNGLDARRAALTEPLAVGLHAVNAARLSPGDVALVVGCGPIGLAVIAALRRAGHGQVVASDLSPARRALAEQAGADVVVDPATGSAYEPWVAQVTRPLPPSPLLTPDQLGATGQAVVFDCAGAPGLLAQHVIAAPQHSRVVVVGVCHTPDTFTPVDALTKELSVQFVFAYRPDEFATALLLIAEGDVDVAPWISSTRPLDEVGTAFADLTAGGGSCKVLVEA